MLASYLKFVAVEWRALLFGAFCTFLSTPGQTFFIALFVGSFAADFGLTAGEIGALYLGATLCAAGLLPLAGQWIDRIDLRLFVLGVAGLLACACFVASAAQGPVSLFFSFLLLRLSGQGLMTHTAVTAVARHFGAQRGRALSLTAMGFPLAESTLPALGVFLIAWLGWQTSYAAIGAFVALVAAPLLLWLVRSRSDFTRPAAIPHMPGSSQLLEGFRILARSPFFWLALPMILYMPFVSTALTFHIQGIAAMKGRPAGSVGVAFTFYALGHFFGLVFSGGLIDRFGARRLLPVMNLPLYVAIAALAWFAAPETLFAMLALMGVGSGLVQTTLGAVWAETFGVARLGAIRSFAVMLMVGGTAAGPAVLGALFDHGVGLGWICISFIVCGVLFAALSAVGVAGETRRMRARAAA